MISLDISFETFYGGSLFFMIFIGILCSICKQSTNVEYEFKEFNNTLKNTFNATDCVVCLNPLENQKSSILHCGHIFHEKCIKKWIIRKNECPVCKNLINLNL